MKKYQCHKQVHAQPMSRGDYNTYRGWDIPKNENPNDEGYLVVYNQFDKENHYESWSPKKVFDEGYTIIDNPTDDITHAKPHTFGWALELMKRGKRLTRIGWNGKDMFSYHVPENSYTAQTDAIKGQFKYNMVPYRAYLSLKTAQEDVALWTPSNSDLLAEDWRISQTDKLWCESWNNENTVMSTDEKVQK